MVKEFVAFLKEYQVIGLAIAVIIAGKAGELVKALVDQLIMPFIGLMVPGGDWRSMVFTISDTKFGVGVILGAAVDFTIVAFFIFMFVKHVMKEEKVKKI